MRQFRRIESAILIEQEDSRDVLVWVYPDGELEFVVGNLGVDITDVIDVENLPNLRWLIFDGETFNDILPDGTSSMKRTFPSTRVMDLFQYDDDEIEARVARVKRFVKALEMQHDRA
jgi:hypothetical protein